jgi:hypothetical protein
MSVIFRMRLQIMNMARTSSWRDAILVRRLGNLDQSPRA